MCSVPLLAFSVLIGDPSNVGVLKLIKGLMDKDASNRKNIFIGRQIFPLVRTSLSINFYSSTRFYLKIENKQCYGYSSAVFDLSDRSFG